MNFIRYADDFVITGKSKELLEGEAQPLVEQFLQERGLELSPTKTVITHVEKGFDFLGQNVRRYPNGKLLIKPSRKNVKTFLDGIRRTIKAALGFSAADLIEELNPKIRGWANYHRHVVSKRTFARADYEIFPCLWRWARRRHRNKNLRWLKEKYFERHGSRTGLSSEKSTTTKGSRTKCGYCWLVTHPSNDMSRSSAKRTLTIPPLKPTLKNEKDFTCGRHFGALVHFAISGTSNTGSARSASYLLRGLPDGACTIASLLCGVVQECRKPRSTSSRVP